MLNLKTETRINILRNKNFKINSLKSKLLFTTLSIIFVTMLLLSLVTFYYWRNLIIDKELKNAESVTEAFSVFVLNTIIYGETLSLDKEYIIDSYISDIIGKNSEIKFIDVYDVNGNIIASNDYNNKKLNKNNIKFEKTFIKTTKVDRGESNWFIQCTYKLATGKKSWGILSIGFNGNKMKQEINSLFKILVIFQLVILFVLFVVLYLLIDKITASLTKLTSFVENLEFGFSDKIILSKRQDEVGVLTNSFIGLQQRLRNSRKNLIKAEKQVFHAEKLASIGRLASGVAHEINNPLNGIKNCLFTIKREIDKNDSTNKYLELAEEGLNNIETVVKKLLGFARKQSEDVVSIDLNTEIKKVLELLNYRLVNDNILLKLNMDENLPEIKSDSMLIQEVLMNILLNAYDAVGKNGEIEISTKGSKKHIKISIKDNGKGILDEDLDKIFEPFYSTKEQGKGTGLGLSVAASILQSLKGEIYARNHENGAEFTIIFQLENEK